MKIGGRYNLGPLGRFSRTAQSASWSGGLDPVLRNCRPRLCSTETDALCLLLLLFVSSSMSRFRLLSLPNFRLLLCLDRCRAQLITAETAREFVFAIRVNLCIILSPRDRYLTEAMKRLEAKIPCAADVQQVLVN